MARAWIAGATLVAVPSLCLAGSTAQPPPSAIPVRVEITADEPLRGALHACLQQELNTEASVLVEQGPALTLAVLASEQRMTDGEMLGYLIYAGGYQPGPQCTGGSKGGELPTVLIQWQILRMVPPELQAACKRLASEFLVSVVEPTRRERDRIRAGTKPAKSRR